ncbi:MAG: CCA tRNA nucleotidyltransferase [Gemmatimonadota bacterium]
MTFPDRLPIPEEVLEIARTLEANGFEAWCVGGALRDALLGDPQADFDIATSATPEQVQRLFRHTVPVGIRFGTVGVLDRRRRLHEVTTFRRDVATDGRHAVVEYGVSLEEDLARRDFTINAIAYHPLRGEWVDPFDGAGDLERRVVRAVGVAAERFREDYLRILRALRFAARLDFTIDPETWAAACAAVPGLAGLSAERVRDEWFKSLDTARSIERLVRLWKDVGAAAIWLPELKDPAPLPLPPPAQRDPVLLTCLLCTRPSEVLRRLRASNAEIDRAAAIETGPAEPAGIDERSVRHWLARHGRAADDLTALWQLKRGVPAPWARTAAAIRERGDPLSRKDLAVTGADLLAAGVPGGPHVGQMLDRLLDVVLDDPARNEKEHLLAIAREGLIR